MICPMCAWSSRELPFRECLRSELDAFDTESRLVSARLPEDTSAAYLSLTAENWLTTTSNVAIPGAL